MSTAREGIQGESAIAEHCSSVSPRASKIVAVEDASSLTDRLLLCLGSRISRAAAFCTLSSLSSSRWSFAPNRKDKQKQWHAAERCCRAVLFLLSSHLPRSCRCQRSVVHLFCSSSALLLLFLRLHAAIVLRTSMRFYKCATLVPVLWCLARRCVPVFWWHRLQLNLTT